MKRMNEIDLIAHQFGAARITHSVGLHIELYTPLADYYSREHAALNPPRDHLVYMLRRLYRACLVYNKKRRGRSAVAYHVVRNCYTLLLNTTLTELEDSPSVSIHRV